MIEPNDQLERLVSRYLDGECTPEERRQLRALCRRDSNAESFFEETVALDAEIGRAMRGALGQPVVVRRAIPAWVRISRVVGLSAAAFLVWLAARNPYTSHSGPIEAPARHLASWFSPRPTAADVFDASSRYDRPEVRLNKAERDWILVPSDTPGEFLIVEVKHVRSRTIPVQEDF